MLPESDEGNCTPLSKRDFDAFFFFSRKLEHVSNAEDGAKWGPLAPPLEENVNYITVAAAHDQPTCAAIASGLIPKECTPLSPREVIRARANGDQTRLKHPALWSTVC